MHHEGDTTSHRLTTSLPATTLNRPVQVRNSWYPSGKSATTTLTNHDNGK